MFERFTQSARRVIFFARGEAIVFGSTRIETEHLLLGIVRENSALLERFLSPAQIDSIRERVQAKMRTEPETLAARDVPLSNAAKNAMILAVDASVRSGDKFVGPQHLLLGLLQIEKSLAAVILVEMGLTLNQVRAGLAGNPLPLEDPESPEIRERSEAGSTIGQLTNFWPAFHSYTEAARRVIFDAFSKANLAASSSIDTEHLLGALLRDDSSSGIPLMGTDSADWIREGATLVGPGGFRAFHSNVLPLSERCKDALKLAAEEAQKLGHPHVRPEHLLIGLLQVEKEFAARLLAEKGLSLSKLREELQRNPSPPGGPDSW